MQHDSDDASQWFTAGEVAGLVRRLHISEVPTTTSGMIKWIKRQASASPGEWRDLSRKRAGREGGGGTEYHWHLFSGYRTKQLVKALEAEVAKRGDYDSKDDWAETMHANLVWEYRRQPGEISFSPDDWKVMIHQLPRDPYIHRVVKVQRRKVRRQRVADTYWAHDLREFEGKWVAVAWFGYEWERWACIWRYNEHTGELERHGKEGLICVIEPPPPQSGVEWERLAIERGDLPSLSPEEKALRRIMFRSWRGS